MTARTFDEVMKDATLGDVHVPGGGGGNAHKKPKARTLAEVLDDPEFEKAFNADQPRDKNGRWTAGGNVLAEFSSKNTAHGTLNGVAFGHWDAPNTLREWANVDGQNPGITEPPFEEVKGKHNGAGVIIKEPDGRVWMVKPANGYGGYKGTFPKGTQDEGLSLQATAIKEAWEESGLKVRITGFAADVERDTSKARYYFAERVGGTPSDHGPESEGVVLVPPARAHEVLNRSVDRKLAHNVIGAPPPPPEPKPKPAIGWHQGSAFEDSWGFMPKLKKALPLDQIIAAQPVAMTFDDVMKMAQVSGNLCRTPDGKFVACGLMGEGGMDANTQAKLSLASKAEAHGLPMPKKSVGSATNLGHYQKAEALLDAAAKGDLAALDTFIDATEGKKGTLTQNLNQYAKDLKSDVASKLANDEAASEMLASKPPRAPKVKQGDELPDVSGWKKVGGQLGSNPGGIYEDGTGQKWYVKQSKSDDHAKNEHLAGVLYKMAGVPTTNPQLVNVGGGKLGIATIWQDKQGFDPDSKADIDAARATFATHAWTGNYDAVGLTFDNQAKIGGTMTTVDVGGSLIYRAQGALKKDFGDIVTELNTMRDPTIAPQAAKIFGGMSNDEMLASTKAVAAIPPEEIKAAVMKFGPGGVEDRKALAEKMVKRRTHIVMLKEKLEVAAASKAARTDAPKPELKQPKVRTPELKPKPGMPNFEAVKLPVENTNAKSHNAKIDAIKSLSEVGNADGILAMQYGIGNYSKKQVATANAALAAMGSDKLVVPGQKKGEHPAVSGKPWAVAAASVADKSEPQAPKPQAKLEPSKLSKPPSFSNWQGTGKGLSSKAEVNAANEDEAKAVFALATKGDLAGLKAYTLKSPSKHVAAYKDLLEQELDEQLNPPEPLKLLQHKGGDFKRLSKELAGKPLGTKATKVAKNEQVGYFIALGVAKGGPAWEELSKQAKELSGEFKSSAPKVIQKLSPAARAAVQYRQAGNSWADMVREGKLDTTLGKFTAGQMAEAMNKESVEMPAYTKLYRYFGMPPGAVAKMKNLEPGTVLQDMNPACTTYEKGATSGFGSHELEIITLPGAKAMPSFGTGSYQGEKEVTMQAGWRMMVVGVDQKSGGSLHIKAALLPPP